MITGDGKGKTTSALGMALRAAGHGWRTLMIQFMKGDPEYGEVKAAAHIPGFEIVQSGLPTFVRRHHPGEKDLALARAGMERARAALSGGRHDMVILDEINVAVDYGLVEAGDVLSAIDARAAKTTVVLTGRYAPEQFIAVADTVSEIIARRHHFDGGAHARDGIEH